MNYSVMFSRLLENTTNSYKYLFLKAITEKVLQKEQVINIDDLIIDMLVLAWYPNQYFKLSLGLQDQIGNVFNQQNFNYSSSTPITSSAFKSKLRIEVINCIDISIIRNQLADYVQYRLLTPFFSDELRGKKDQVKNGMIFDLAERKFNDKHPLYKIHSDKKSITVNSLWVEFININISILDNYQKLKWVEYLQKNNPNTSAIIYKTEPPLQRSSLVTTQKYWDKFIQENDHEKCIYTGKKLITLKTSIDHFLPWSFVCHDRLWNLIPVNASTNSSKSNTLPSLDYYLQPFIEQQSRALSFHVESINGWEKHAEYYIQDLGFKNRRELLDQQVFSDRLSQTIENQYSLAKQLGFSSHWKYKPN